MTFGRDSYGIEQQCVVCDTPTKSHPVPNGYLCHSCLTEEDESVILDALPIAPRPALGVDSTVECCECENEHTIRDAHTPGGDVIRAGVGFSLFDSLTAFVWVSCPSCAVSTEYLTTEESAEELASTLGVDLMSYSRRKGWAE
jgi:hypothetical protein